MKKFLFLLILCAFVAACTTKEQDAQIENFWNQQIVQVMFKMMGQGQTADRLNSLALSHQQDAGRTREEKEMQEMEDLMKQWEDAQNTLEQEEFSTTATTQMIPLPPEQTPAPVQVSPQDQAQAQSQTQSQAQAQAPAQPQAQAPAQSQAQAQTPAQPQAAAQPRKTPARRKSKPRPSNQFMEITLEDSSDVVQGKAPLKDRQAMQRALDKVMQDNQNTIQDIGSIFGPDAQAEVFAITTKTEKALRRQARQSLSLQAYLKVQQQLLKQQEQSLNQLIAKYSRQPRRQ